MMYVHVPGTDGLMEDWKRKHCIVFSVKQGRLNNFLLEKYICSIYHKYKYIFKVKSHY